MDIVKSVTVKVVSGLVGLAVIVCAISWYRTDPDTRSLIEADTGRIFAWCGVVLVVPWVSFALIGWVGRMESNGAGAVLVGALTLMELLLLAYLFHWMIHGSTAWTFLVLGGLVAALYNLLTCDWIAEKVG